MTEKIKDRKNPRLHHQRVLGITIKFRETSLNQIIWLASQGGFFESSLEFSLCFFNSDGFN